MMLQALIPTARELQLIANLNEAKEMLIPRSPTEDLSDDITLPTEPPTQRYTDYPLT